MQLTTSFVICQANVQKVCGQGDRTDLLQIVWFCMAANRKFWMLTAKGKHSNSWDKCIWQREVRQQFSTSCVSRRHMARDIIDTQLVGTEISRRFNRNLSRPINYMLYLCNYNRRFHGKVSYSLFKYHLKCFHLFLKKTACTVLLNVITQLWMCCNITLLLALNCARGISI